MPVKPARAPLAQEEASGGMALLIVDMISTWDFDDADKIAPRAVEISRRIGALKRRCVEAGAPPIYVNDNSERWRSEFREQVRTSIEISKVGASIAASLRPSDAERSTRTQLNESHGIATPPADEIELPARRDAPAR